MSPTERDLRAALRDGEGEGPDVDRLIAGGRARRQQRRVRLGATAAGVAFVAAAATGTFLLVGHGDNRGSSVAGADRSAATAADGQANGAAASSAAGGHARPAPPQRADIACPGAVPRQLLPGGGSPGQFGSDGPLFAQPVSSVVVCAYGPRASVVDTPPAPLPGRLLLRGAQAQQLVASLEQASKARRPCPTAQNAAVREYALIGVTAGGGTLRLVTVELADPGCRTMVTNGTAIRYGWQPPAGLGTVLAQLHPAAGPARSRAGSPHP